MSLMSIFDIAGSALSAQSQRMNVSASNMANADSVVGPDGQPYRARQVVFQVNPAPGQAKHPLADAQGYISMPNVDPVAETVNMIAASRSYQANVEVLNTAKSLMQKTLTIGQS